MQRVVDLLVSPAVAADAAQVQRAAELAAGWKPGSAAGVRVQRRSIDARGRQVRMQLRVELSDEGPFEPDQTTPPALPDVARKEPVVIVGAGPAGLFAALRCIALGRRPVVLDRGKEVRARRHDLAAITQRGVVDPDSNYCFGEGGAGTFSDGKLFTRSTKRGDVGDILRTLVAYGASPDILVDAHPHIGTNRLPALVTRIREAILAAGGEVRFGARMTDLSIRESKVRGVVLSTGEEVVADAVVLATGHSARDVFELLARRGVAIEHKDFALGVRVEHPQEVIDAIRYHAAARDPLLPPASYSAAVQVDGLGVYSFCMCPGGVIAPCATAPGEVVTNGWSPSKRNNPFANSGVVVEVHFDRASDGPLAGVEYQRSVEQAAWDAGGKTLAAPAQRLVDFLGGRESASLPESSYRPGLVSRRIDELLPPDISRRLQAGLRAFGHKMRGYLTREAVVVAVESRTSSPVRIPRHPDRLDHVQVGGLFPCGEGAGYAGGIVSSAMDGTRCAESACLRRP